MEAKDIILIPKHAHIQSLYVFCDWCGILGTPTGTPFEEVICGNCGKKTDKWLVPRCCVKEILKNN